jgi:hypothetical protein
MPGKIPDWKNPKIIKAAKDVTQSYYRGEIKNRWELEIKFHQLTGYSQRFSTIMKYAKEVNHGA